MLDATYGRVGCDGKGQQKDNETKARNNNMADGAAGEFMVVHKTPFVNEAEQDIDTQF
jgi:hypothetical protein